MNQPRRYRKKPTIVSAVQFTGDNVAAVQAMTGTRRFRAVAENDTSVDPGSDALVWDVFHSSWIGVRIGQWIIVGIRGETYPIDPDVFADTYELVDEEFEVA